MKVTATPEFSSPCLKLQQYFHEIIQVVQMFLDAAFNEVYLNLVETNVKTVLADAKFYQVLTNFNFILKIQKKG